MTKHYSSFIIFILVFIAGAFLTENLDVFAYTGLAPIPEVGPGACAWSMSNGLRCDESYQRCAPGCPCLYGTDSAGNCNRQPFLSNQGAIYDECDENLPATPSSYQGVSSIDSSDPCQNSYLLSCASTCADVKLDKKQICFASCISKNHEAVKAFAKCSKQGEIKLKKRDKVRAQREARQQARDEARRTGAITSVSPKPITPSKSEKILPAVIPLPKTEAPFDFTITVSPSHQKVSPGSAAKYSVRVLPKGKGKPKSVLLTLGGKSIFDLVENKRAYWSFDGSTSKEGMPPFSTSLTIMTTDSSIPGDYALAVRGTGGTASRSGDFELEILASTKIETPLAPPVPEWSEVKDKLAKAKGQTYAKGEDYGKPLTQDEFMVYMRELEHANPDMNWKTLVAYLHARAYEEKGDLKRTLGKTLQEHPDLEKIPFLKDAVSNTPLFLHVPETNQYKNVKDIAELYARYIIDKDGNKIDLAHSYAGLRSDIGRIPGSPDQKNMLMVNTDLGDYFQVAMELNRNKYNKGKSWEQVINEAKSFAPPDQLQGNTIGQALSKYYQNPANANKKLSEAYADLFSSKR